MKLIVLLQHVQIKVMLAAQIQMMVQLVFISHGYVMAGQIVQMVLMKLTVLLFHVKIKVYGIVVMANVYQHGMFAMVLLLHVMQAGDLIVLMAQMKV